MKLHFSVLIMASIFANTLARPDYYSPFRSIYENYSGPGVQYAPFQGSFNPFAQVQVQVPWGSFGGLMNGMISSVVGSFGRGSGFPDVIV